jgi:hypothetical protein
MKNKLLVNNSSGLQNVSLRGGRAGRGGSVGKRCAVPVALLCLCVEFVGINLWAVSSERFASLKLFYFRRISHHKVLNSSRSHALEFN